MRGSTARFYIILTKAYVTHVDFWVAVCFLLFRFTYLLTRTILVSFRLTFHCILCWKDFLQQQEVPTCSRKKEYVQMDAERPKAVIGMSKIFVRSKVRTQKGLDRRERRNAGARANAATKRALVEELAERDHSQMTKEEIGLMEKTETARERKNRRSHEIHTEKKDEIDRILSKTAEERTAIELKFLEQGLSAKRRKNEGDRLRRLRLKELGYPASRNTGKIGVSARGPIPAPAGYPGASAVSATTSAASLTATAAAAQSDGFSTTAATAQSDGFSIATAHNPTNLLTYGYQ
jgi:hypothetical protein